MDLAGTAVVGLATRPRDRQTQDCSGLASPRVPALLGMEEPPTGAGKTESLGGREGSDSQDEPTESSPLRCVEMTPTLIAIASAMSSPTRRTGVRFGSCFDKSPVKIAT